MPQIIEVLGVGPVSFPDGMSREDIAAALKQLPAPAAAPKPKTDRTPLRDSWLGGVLRGLRDPIDEGALLLTRGVEGLAPAGSAFEAWAKSERQRVEAINKAAEEDYQTEWRRGQMDPRDTDYGRLGGNVLATAVPGTTMAIRAGAAPFQAGATGGAISGLLSPSQPASSPSQYFANKAEQTGLATMTGGLGGKVASGVGRVLLGAPKVSPGAAAATGDVTGTAAAGIEANVAPTATVRGGGMSLGQVGPDTSAALTEGQRLALQQGRALGMKVTPGQETGSRSLQQMEARMESNPFFSGPFNAIKAENQQTLNRAAAKAIGEDATELSSPVLARASERIGKVFDDVASPKVFPIDGESVMNGIALTSSYYDDVAGVAIADQNLVKQAINLAAKGSASGEQLRALSSKLGRAAKNQSSSPSGNRELGEALFAVKEHLDDALASTLTASQRKAFDAARQQYRQLMTLEGSGVVNSANGNVSGLNLAGALARKDKQGYFYGKNQTPMYQATRFAQAFKPLVGDSGTATRTMELTPLNMMLAMPTNLAARAYTSGAARAAARASTGEGVVGGMMNPATRAAMQRALPVTGGALGSGLLQD